MVEEYRGFDRDAVAAETQAPEWLEKRLGEVIMPHAVKLEFPEEE